MLSALWTYLRRFYHEPEMIQRRNSRRFVLSELCTEEESEAEAESGEPDPGSSSSSQVDSPPSYPPSYPPDSPYRESPPTQWELLKWRSIKSLRSQIT